MSRSVKRISILLSLLATACGQAPAVVGDQELFKPIPTLSSKDSEAKVAVQPYGVYRRQQHICFKEVFEASRADPRSIAALTRSSRITFNCEDDLLMFFTHRALTREPVDSHAFRMEFYEVSSQIPNPLYLDLVEFEKLLKSRVMSERVKDYSHEMQAEVMLDQPSQGEIDLLAAFNRVLRSERKLELSDFDKGFTIDNIRNYGPVEPTVRPESLVDVPEK